MLRELFTKSLLPAFVPLGPDKESVRRIPIVTLGIIGACALVLLCCELADIPSTAETAEIDGKLQRVIDYWDAHPALFIPEWAEGTFDKLSRDQRRRLGDLKEAPPGEDDPTDEAAQDQFARLWLDLDSTFPDDPRESLGFRGSDPTAITALTHLFTHADLSHFFWNMVFLFVCAVMLEDVWGRAVFLVFYLVAGLVAIAPDVLIFPDRPGYTIGASGAIAAVMGAFAVRFWKVRMRLLFVIGIVGRPVWISSWLITTLWFARDIIMIPGQLEGGGVHHIAHVAGFVFGALFAFGTRFLMIEERGLAAAVAAKSTRIVFENAHIEQSLADLSEGRDAVAQKRLLTSARLNPENIDTALALWRVSMDLGTPHVAAQAMARAIELQIRAGDLANAVEQWRELVSHVPAASMDAASLMRIAKGLADRGLRAEAIDALRHALVTQSHRAPCATLLSIGAMLHGLEDELSITAAEAVLNRPDATSDEIAQAKALRRRRHRVDPAGFV